MGNFSEHVKFVLSANNEDIFLTFLQNTYDHTLILYKIDDLERLKFKVTPRIHWFSKVRLYLKN